MYIYIIRYDRNLGGCENVKIESVDPENLKLQYITVKVKLPQGYTQLIPEIEDKNKMFAKYLQLNNLDNDLEFKMFVQMPSLPTDADNANIPNKTVPVDLCTSHSIDNGVETPTEVVNVSKRSARGNKTIVAYHEAGHTVLGWMLEQGHSFVLVSIKPTANILGLTRFIVTDINQLAEEGIAERLCILAGGSCAEKFFCKRMHGGAHADLKRLAKISLSQSSRLIVQERIERTAFNGTENVEVVLTDEEFQLAYNKSDGIFTRAIEQASRLVVKYRKKLRKVAMMLVQHDVLYRDDLIMSLGPRRYKKCESEMCLDGVISVEEYDKYNGDIQ